MRGWRSAPAVTARGFGLLAVTLCSGCQGAPQIDIRSEGMHADHVTDEATRDHHAYTRGLGDTLLVRGHLPGRVRCATVTGQVARRDSILTVEILLAQRPDCLEFETPTGMAYEARITHLPPGTYFVAVRHTTARDSARPVHHDRVRLR